jgi:VWFA-related protein
LTSIESRVQFALTKLEVPFLVAALFCCSAHGQSKAKLPKPKQLDRDIQFTRDAVTGEVKTVPVIRGKTASAEPPPEHSSPAIRSEVRLVQASCSALGADGSSMRDLAQTDFRLAADARPQEITSLDASTEPAHIVLLLDASPSEYRSLENMKSAVRALAAELSAKDEAAVVAFAGHTHLLLPFSTDRALLEQAVGRVQLLRNTEETGSSIYGSMFLAARELFTGARARGGRKAVILLTDGQDTSLKLSWDPAAMFPPAGGANFLTFEDVIRELASSGIETFAISTENRPAAMTSQWLAERRGATLISKDSRRLEIPAYTIYLAELVRRAGGALYFLREIGTLSDVYRRIASELRTEYLLGFYPDETASKAGWHQLQVQLASKYASAGANLSCRPAYYVPASPGN